MSATPVFSAAATGRPIIFSPSSAAQSGAEKKTVQKAAMSAAEILSRVGAMPKLAAVVPASRLEARPAPEMVSSGIPQLDALTEGFARGCLTEICGSASSGRTSVLLIALARATQRGEVCALVDASDAFDPASAAAAGMEMNRLLWVRCGGAPPLWRSRNEAASQGKPSMASRIEETMMLETRHSAQALKRESISTTHATAKNRAVPGESQLAQMLKVTDLLLQSNGFGMIALDLGDVAVESARRIPLASWFRFRRVIEHTPTVLLVLEQRPIAGSSSSVLLQVSGCRSQVPWKKLSVPSTQYAGNSPAHSEPPHSELLDRFEITVELLRSRLEPKLERKPVQSTARFHSRASWAG